MSIFKEHYPRLMYKAKDEHPGFDWKTVKDPDEAAALGPEWHDTPAQAIEHRVKSGLKERAGEALEQVGAALQTRGERMQEPAPPAAPDPAQEQAAAEHSDAPAVVKGRRRR